MMTSAGRAFLAQNERAAETLLLVDIAPYAEMHSGGLVVLGAPAASGGNYVKMHDSWGPGKPDEQGDIVVHAYDPDPDPATFNTVLEPREYIDSDGIPRQDWNDGSSVWFFDSGREAFEFFLGRIG